MIIYSWKHIVTQHLFQFHYSNSLLHYHANVTHLFHKRVDPKYTLLRHTKDEDTLVQNELRIPQERKKRCST